MKLYTTVAVLLLFLVGSTLSDCWIYGHCNPGPNCRNDDNRCWDCRDGGYIHQHQYDNGFADCKSGNDERDEQLLIPTKKFPKHGQRECKPRYAECTQKNSKECCSRECRCTDRQSIIDGMVCVQYQCD